MPTLFTLLELQMKTTIAVLVLSLLVACTPKKIPGTEIDDNDDTRAILAVMEEYRKAVETKNAQTIVDLADPTFKDDGGSAALDDDLEYSQLFTVLPARLSKMDEIKVEVSVRKIEIDRELGTARATYTYNTSFRLPGMNPKPQSESDI
ncbi:MAG: putative lipoprotein, partial [Myxococcaceae bacterium]|nr:putative lipoprotein [Myxococcaceae bacterium]